MSWNVLKNGYYQDPCREHMVAFMHKCHITTQKIMSCFAVGLGLHEDFFKEVSLLHECMLPTSGSDVAGAMYSFHW